MGLHSPFGLRQPAGLADLDVCSCIHPCRLGRKSRSPTGCRQGSPADDSPFPLPSGGRGAINFNTLLHHSLFLFPPGPESVSPAEYLHTINKASSSFRVSNTEKQSATVPQIQVPVLHGPGTQPSANSTKRLPSSRFCASLSFATLLPTITHQPSNEQPQKLSPTTSQPGTDASGKPRTINDSIDFLLISIRPFRPPPFFYPTRSSQAEKGTEPTNSTLTMGPASVIILCVFLAVVAAAIFYILITRVQATRLGVSHPSTYF